MEFFLFILVNAALFIRPGEVIPELEGWPVYQWLILASLAVSAPRVLGQFTGRSLARRPVTLCVFGVWVAVVLSHLARMATIEARLEGFEFGKVILYYLLLVGVVDSPARLRRFLGWLAVLVVALAGLAVLRYHGFAELPGSATVNERYVDPETGAKLVIARLCATGIFNDPNDLCLALTLGTLVGLYYLIEGRGPARALWLGPLALFVYTLHLTQSRGGLVGLASGLIVLCGARFGWRKAVPLTALLLPALLLVASSRQTNFDLSDRQDTGQTRVQLWSQGLQLFRESPVFGIGSGFYAEKVGLVAHNSFVHAFTELGFAGGTLFLGAFFAALASLARLGSDRVLVLDPGLRALRPYVLAVVAAYCAGMLSLSRNYVVLTYLVLGLAQAYVATAATAPADAAPSPKALARWLVPLGVGTLVVTYVTVQLLVRWN